MSIGASPPQLPPQISPDGKWIWDGHAWQAVPPPAPGEFVEVPAIPGVGMKARHTAVVEVVAEPSAPPEPQYVAPASYAYQPPQVVVPLWQQTPKSSATTYLYFAAAAVVLIMAMIFLNSMNIIELPWLGSGSSGNSPQPTPAVSPLTNRTDFARADRFLNSSVGPALKSAGTAFATLNTCTGTLSNACFTAVTASDQQMKNVLKVVDHGDIPPCIAVPMAKLRSDFAGMETGLALTLTGFKDNSRSEAGTGLRNFVSAAQLMNIDAPAVDRAEKTQCNTQLVGP